MAKKQITALFTALLACSTVLAAPTTVYDVQSGPTGTLWTGLAQMSVTDSNLCDSGLKTGQHKGLTKLTSTLFGGESSDPNLAGLPNGAGTKELFVKMMISVVLVVVLGGVAIYGSKRLAGKLVNMPGKKIKIVETAHLGPRKAVHLLRIGDRCLLIGSTNDNITKLADLTTEILIQEKTSSDSQKSSESDPIDSSVDFGAALEPSDALANLSTTYAENN
ncbi:MAG: flagellar biosynthetic protein FliO [Planctomycetota bacterium]